MCDGKIYILFSAFSLLFDDVVVFLLSIPSFCRLPSAHFLGTQALESNKWHIGNGIFSYFIFPSKFSCCSGYLGDWVLTTPHRRFCHVSDTVNWKTHIEFARQSSLSKHGTHGKFVSLAEKRTEIEMNSSQMKTCVTFKCYLPISLSIVEAITCRDCDVCCLLTLSLRQMLKQHWFFGNRLPSLRMPFPRFCRYSIFQPRQTIISLLRWKSLCRGRARVAIGRAMSWTTRDIT